MSTEQLIHDEVNLIRLLRRLEKSTSTGSWLEDLHEATAWIRSQNLVQTVGFAKRLLKNVEQNKPSQDPQVIEDRRMMRSRLEHLEIITNELATKHKPAKKERPSLLAGLPLPSPPQQEVAPPEEPEVESPEVKSPTQDLLLSPSESIPPPPNLMTSPSELLPPTMPSFTKSTIPDASTSAVAASAKFLHNSNALQQELQDQLAQMATQLRKNAVHFSDSLVKDKAVIEDLGVKLEGNFDVMSKERVRLRDHSGKSKGTTWLTVLSVVVVIISFIIMVWVIRFSKYLPGGP